MIDEEQPDLVIAFIGDANTDMTVALAEERDINIIQILPEGDEWQSSI
jgi:hypothetical protein